MTAISTKSSVLFLMTEVTEGTPVVPAGATDAVALQDDFSIEPGTQVLENAEIRASIGAAKVIIGSEAPNCSFSHYVKASGTAGTAPEWNLLMKALLGTEVVASTEYDLDSGSTGLVFNVPSGEGVQFQRGQAVLLKDAVNGFRVRALKSVAGDVLTPGFSVPNAPASGVNLGKCVLWKPANEGHISLTVWNYVGNGGARQVMSGARVTSMALTAQAGQLINANFSLEGTNFFFNPIEITSSTRYIDWEDDDGVAAAAITAKWYSNPHEVAEALTTAMNSVGSSETAAVTYNDTTGKFKILTTGTLLTLKWNTGANTANTIGTKIGFLVAADDSGTAAATGYSSDNAQTLVAPYTPSFDTTDPLAAKNQEVMVGDADDYACFKASAVSINVTNTKRNIDSICAETGIDGSVISGRAVTIQITALLNQYDADKFNKYRKGDELGFQYTMGVKVGGNWVAGKIVYAYSPTATISAINVSNDDGLATLNMTLTCFVNSTGEGEFFMGTL